jgi:hypothetical protein
VGAEISAWIFLKTQRGKHFLELSNLGWQTFAPLPSEGRGKPQGARFLFRPRLQSEKKKMFQVDL